MSGFIKRHGLASGLSRDITIFMANRVVRMSSSKPAATNSDPAKVVKQVQDSFVILATILRTALLATHGKLNIVEPKKSDVSESDAAPRTKTP